jgi:hypothetical protein
MERGRRRSGNKINDTIYMYVAALNFNSLFAVRKL